MQDRTLLRIGAVSLIVSVVLIIIFGGALHPLVTDPSDIETQLQLIAASPSWAGIHVLILVPFLLGVGGLLALHRSITGDPGAALAQLGFAAVLVGAAIVSVGEVLEGSSAMKALADAWNTAVDKSVPFAVAEAVLMISWPLISWGDVVFLGVAPILYGLAIALTDFYPRWLGWVAVVGGVGIVLTGIVVFSQGISQVTNIVWGAFAVVDMLWMVAMGVLMWRKAGAPANP